MKTLRIIILYGFCTQVVPNYCEEQWVASIEAQIYIITCGGIMGWRYRGRYLFMFFYLFIFVQLHL